MTVALASTWLPRGELPRFERFYPRLAQLYSHMVIVFPSIADAETVERIQSFSNVTGMINSHPGAGRYPALQKALKTGAETIHYCDFDRLIRWIELHEEELVHTLEYIHSKDVVMIGRTEEAFMTHPKSQIVTERIINNIFSHLLGQPLDLTAGSKAFSHHAVEVLMANAAIDDGMHNDATWAVILHRAGFQLSSITVDGLDFESADRFMPQAADAETQRRFADEYDANPEHWLARTQLAQDIIRAGLEMFEKELTL